jgi:hypothetical protein
MSLTLRRVKKSRLTWDEVDDNWEALLPKSGGTLTGTLLLDGAATAWDDLVIPLVQGKQGMIDKPAWDATECGYLFPQNDPSEFLFLNAQLPHRWALGTGDGSTIYPHVHWHQARNETPVFKMDYRWIGIGDAVPAGWQTYTMGALVKTYTSGTMHQISHNATGIDGAGKGMSSILQIKLYRDDNVYAADALATSFDIHVEIDSFGSDTEYAK